VSDTIFTVVGLESLRLSKRLLSPDFLAYRMYIDDCVQGTPMLAGSDFAEPLNIGSSELVSINQLVDIVEEMAAIKLKRNYNLSAPKGVNGRNSDNTLIEKVLGWEPSTRLRDGMEKTYRWIHDQIYQSS
jgi:GDP-D-mannose 3', 5'-epimerase